MNFEGLCNSITTVLSNTRSAIQTVPAVLLSLCAISRPGLSATEVASKIIQRQTEAGAPFGPSSDGSQNIAEAMERIRVEEIINAIKLTSRVQIGIPIGGIQIMGVGANSGGPVTVTGINTNFVHGDGVVG